MIHWIPINISIPVFVPTSGQVLVWLLVGLATLIHMAVTTAFNRRVGYCPYVAKDPAWIGIPVTLLILVAWPLPWAIRIREWRRNRPVRYAEPYTINVQMEAR